MGRVNWSTMVRGRDPVYDSRVLSLWVREGLFRSDGICPLMSQLASPLVTGCPETEPGHGPPVPSPTRRVSTTTDSTQNRRSPYRTRVSTAQFLVASQYLPSLPKVPSCSERDGWGIGGGRDVRSTLKQSRISSSSSLTSLS